MQSTVVDQEPRQEQGIRATFREKFPEKRIKIVFPIEQSTYPTAHIKTCGLCDLIAHN